MTYIYKEITKNEFIDAFKAWDSYKDKYSFEGLSAIHDFYLELAESNDRPFMLDVVSIACDWAEYDNKEQLLADYSQYTDIQELKDNFYVIELSNGHILITE